MNFETQLTPRQKLILASILRDLRRVLHGLVNSRKVGNSRIGEGQNSPATPCGKHSQRGKHAARGQRERAFQRIRAAREGLASVNLWRWLGHTPSGVDRVLCHRELLRLEAAGLLKRQAGRSGRRTTHVKLTTLGQQVARQLLAQQGADVTDETFEIGDMPMLPLDWLAEKDP